MRISRSAVDNLRKELPNWDANFRQAYDACTSSFPPRPITQERLDNILANALLYDQETFPRTQEDANIFLIEFGKYWEGFRPDTAPINILAAKDHGLCERLTTSSNGQRHAVAEENRIIYKRFLGDIYYSKQMVALSDDFSGKLQTPIPPPAWLQYIDKKQKTIVSEPPLITPPQKSETPSEALLKEFSECGMTGTDNSHVKRITDEALSKFATAHMTAARYADQSEEKNKWAIVNVASISVLNPKTPENCELFRGDASNLPLKDLYLLVYTLAEISFGILEQTLDGSQPPRVK